MSYINAITSPAPAIVTYADATGNLQLQTGGTTGLTLDGSQNVGIGTTSPSSTTANERIVQVNAPTTYSTLSLSTSRTNTDGQTIGKLSFDVLNNTPTYTSRAQITSQSSGSTANKYGGTLQFFTASDNTTDAAERMRMTNIGQIGWGVTPSNIDGWLTLTWRGQSYVGFVMNNLDATGSSANFRFKNNGTTVGEITSTSSATTYTTSSDYRLKENVAPMTGGLEKVTQLKPVTYTWKNSGEASQGFIAHELQAVVPDAVVGEKDEVNEDGSIKPQGIDTSFLVATLTAAIQELKAINDTQAQTITALTARIEALEKK